MGSSAEYIEMCNVVDIEKIRRQSSLVAIARITRETSVTVNRIMLLVVQLFEEAARQFPLAAGFADSVQAARGVVLVACQAARHAAHATWLEAQHADDKQAEKFARREEAAYQEAQRLLILILQSFDAALKVVLQDAAPTDVSVESVGAALEIKLAALQVAEDVLAAWKSAARDADAARKEAGPVSSPWQFEIFLVMKSRLDENLIWKTARDEAFKKRIELLREYRERNNTWH